MGKAGKIGLIVLSIIILLAGAYMSFVREQVSELIHVNDIETKSGTILNIDEDYKHTIISLSKDPIYVTYIDVQLEDGSKVTITMESPTSEKLSYMNKHEVAVYQCGDNYSLERRLLFRNRTLVRIGEVMMLAGAVGIIIGANAKD